MNFYLLFSHYMKINTRALGTQVTKERPQLMQFGCFEEPNGSDPSVFYSHRVCLRLQQPAFPTLSTGMFSWKPEGEVGDPGKTVLPSGDVASVSPGGTASAGGRRGMFPCHSKEPWLPHAVSPTSGVSLSPPQPCGLWRLGMFPECLLWTWCCRIALISYKRLFLSSRWGYTPGIICG